MAGGLIALGVLVPGLSPSNLLLVLGLYDPMLKGFKGFDILGVFLPIAIGGLLVMLLFSKLMEWLLEHYHSKVYHFILGIVIASTVLIVLPPVADYRFTWLTAVSGVILFVLGYWLGAWMSKLEENINNHCVDKNNRSDDRLFLWNRNRGNLCLNSDVHTYYPHSPWKIIMKRRWKKGTGSNGTTYI